VVGVGSGSSAISIWRQDASGMLQLSDSVSIGSGTGTAIEMADVDGDGAVDLVAAMAGVPGKDIAVILQQPGRTFAAPTYLDTGSVWQARAIAIGDLNGDGRRDIVAATGGNRPTSYLAVFYQDASHNFGVATHVQSNDIPGALRVVDVNGDGSADIVVFHIGFSTVGVYLQQSGGNLGPETLYPAGVNGNFLQDQLAVGDINGDGRPDIVLDGQILVQFPSTLPPLATTIGRASTRGVSTATRSLRGIAPSPSVSR